MGPGGSGAELYRETALSIYFGLIFYPGGSTNASTKAFSSWASTSKIIPRLI